jgi:ABC-type transport system substrate-binding protein
MGREGRAEGYWARAANRRLGRRRLLSGAARGGAALAGAALLGCGLDDEPPAGPSATDATPSPLLSLSDREFYRALPHNPPRDWHDDDLQVGGTAHRLFNRSASSFDFHTARSVSVLPELLTPVYNRLIRLASHSGIASALFPELEPDLATTWERIDDETLLFTLADGIRWHDLAPVHGRAFEAGDVAFTYERGKISAGSAFRSQFEFIDRVEDRGDGRLAVVLSRQHPGAELLLGSWIMMVMPREIGEDERLAQSTAVGTGGFVLEHDRYDPTVEIRYRRNGSYFKHDSQGRQRPYLDALRLLVVDDEAKRAEMFARGEVESAHVTAHPVTIGNLREYVEQIPGLMVQVRPPMAGGLWIAGHHDTDPRWADIRVRRALSLSIDRRRIIDTQTHGLGVSLPYFPWPFVLDSPPPPEALGPWMRHDPAESRRLLEAAGHPGGISMELLWEFFHTEPQVHAVTEMALEGGFRLQLRKSEDSNAQISAMRSRQWRDLVLIARGFLYPDPNDFLPHFMPGSFLNYGEVRDPELVQLIEIQGAASDDARTAALERIWTRMLDQVHEVPLVSGFSPTAWHPRFKNYRDTAWNANSGPGNGQMDGAWLAG